MTVTVADDAEWVDAGDYAFTLGEGNVVVARNAKGRVLKTVPPKARKLPEFEQLDGLRVVLEQHEQLCRDTVQDWFLQGSSIPVTVVHAVWKDQLWRKYLQGLVVFYESATGLLQNRTDDTLQLVDLDGEAIDIPITDSAVIGIPHPALIEEMEQWREFASELGVHQGLDQLFRDVYIKPADADGQKNAVQAYMGGKYARGSHLLGRGRGGGFRTSLGEVAVTVHEGGREIIARLDVSGWDPSDEVEFGTLNFTSDGKTVPLEEVGPVAWSEGIRMCEYIYAGRTVETQE